MSDGQEPETPKLQRKRKATGKRKKAKARGKPKPIVPNKEIASHGNASSRARASAADKSAVNQVRSLEDIQRQVRIEVLLERLAEKGEEITVAARACKIDRSVLWRWRRDLPDLEEKLAEAYRVGTESLVSEARRRGVEGVDEPVFQGGVEVGKKRVYSDTLLLALLRKRDPGGFRDPKHATPVTPPRLAGEVTLDLDAMPADLLALLEAEARRQQAEKQRALAP